eukprot:INCI6306.1.p1 GENE.INCI6306.1~~INCI6306.1.p1  ORF type:complete len:459 (+),score=115.25 INCI6306.1:88-1464(+)
MSYTGRKSAGGRKSMGGRQSLAPSRTQYSFPVLKDSEIIQNVNDMSIPLTETELRQPNYQVLRTIFTNTAEFLMGVTADELNQPKFSGLEELSHPDLHETSVPRLNLFRTSSKLLETCGCHDFSLPDLFKPTYQKLRVYLSAIINFAKFREDQLDAYATKTELQEKLAGELYEKTAVIDDLTRKVEEINAQHEKDMPVIIELQEQKKQLKGVLHERGLLQAKTLEEKDQLKMEYAAVCDKDASVQYQIQEMEADVRTLTAQVVQSPDRIRAEIGELDRRYEEEADVLKQMQEQKIADAAQERERLEAIKQLRKTLEHMRTLEKAQKKYKDATKVFKAHKAQISQLGANITEQEALHEHYVHRSNTCGKKQEVIDHQSTDRSQIETLKKQQDEHDTLQVAYEGGREELQTVLRQMDNVRDQTKRDEESHKQRLRSQFQLLQNVAENFDSVNNQLLHQVQ